MNRFTIFGIVFFLLSLSFPQKTFANLLQNSSFEATASGVPSNWTKNVSTVTLSTSTIVKSGTMSASVNKTNSSTGTIYAYQDVDVEPSSYYSLSGYAVKNSSNFSWVVLRVSWRDSSSSEISKTDSAQLITDSSDFQYLKIDSVAAPSSSIKGRIELVGNITTINPSNPVLFDDIDFSQVVAPEQPTSSPTSTPVPTNTPTPTSAPTSIPTSTITPSPTSAISATSSAHLLDEAASTSADMESVLGDENNNSSNSGDVIVQSSTGKKSNALAGIFIGGGIIFLVSCGILSYYLYKKKEVV